MTVADYVENGITTGVNNGQVRQISGVEDIVQAHYVHSGIGYGDDHRALLEQAWGNMDVVRPDTATKFPTPNDADVFRRYNRQDCELYQRCKEVFELGAGPVGRLRRLLIGRS